MGRCALLKAVELGPNKVSRVEIDGHPPVAVYNLNGEFFATDDTCTHGEASLADGDIEDANIVCPFHLGMFDIRTGEPTGAPCAVAIRTYPLTIEDGFVYLQVDA